MSNLTELYGKYRTMPSLREHQRRVAGVAALLADSIPGTDRDTVITACLFHDMGNIIKFDLAYFPEFLEPEGAEYWRKVKEEYVSLYGHDEHVATRRIAEEIGLPERAIACIEAIGFSRLPEVLRHGTLEQKICSYADQRVSPRGVVSLSGRLEEGRRRYAGRRNADEAWWQERVEALREVERQIFSRSDLRPEDVTEEKIKDLLQVSAWKPCYPDRMKVLRSALLVLLAVIVLVGAEMAFSLRHQLHLGYMVDVPLAVAYALASAFVLYRAWKMSFFQNLSAAKKAALLVLFGALLVLFGAGLASILSNGVEKKLEDGTVCQWDIC